MIEHRKYIRLRAPIGIVYRQIQRQRRSKPTLTLVLNISGGGLSLIAKDDFRQGDLLELDIHIPHLEEPVRAVGEVVWFFSSAGKERDRSMREAGVRFRDLATKDLNCILEYVHTIGIG
jgi:c-di-GMP-binding flagellar brake protein YcgR